MSPSRQAAACNAPILRRGAGQRCRVGTHCAGQRHLRQGLRLVPPAAGLGSPSAHDWCPNDAHAGKRNAVAPGHTPGRRRGCTRAAGSWRGGGCTDPGACDPPFQQRESCWLGRSSTGPGNKSCNVCAPAPSRPPRRLAGETTDAAAPGSAIRPLRRCHGAAGGGRVGRCADKGAPAGQGPLQGPLSARTDTTRPGVGNYYCI